MEGLDERAAAAITAMEQKHSELAQERQQKIDEMNKRTKDLVQKSPKFKDLEEGYRYDPKKPGKYVIKELESRKKMLASI